MKFPGRALCLALLALPVGAMASDEKGCDSVNWGEEVLAKFPNAEKACHGVMMKNDAVYAHYVAEIVASDSESVTVHLIDKHEGHFRWFVPIRIRASRSKARRRSGRTSGRARRWISGSSTAGGVSTPARIARR
jgi:hypothetical protein